MSRVEHSNSRKSFPGPDSDSSTTEVLGKIIVRKDGETFRLEKRDREKAFYKGDRGNFLAFRRQFTKTGRGDDFLYRELAPTRSTPGYIGSDKEVAMLNFDRLSL